MLTLQACKGWLMPYSHVHFIQPLLLIQQAYHTSLYRVPVISAGSGHDIYADVETWLTLAKLAVSVGTPEIGIPSLAVATGHHNTCMQTDN